MTAPVRIHLLALESAEAGREALSLRNHLLDLGAPDVAVSIEKSDASTQDVGTIVSLSLGAPAVIALAHGIADWLRKRRIGSTLELKIGRTHIKATGEIADKPEQLARLIAALGGKR